MSELIKIPEFCDWLIVLTICVAILIIAILIAVLHYCAYIRMHPEVAPPKETEIKEKKEDTPEYKERKEFIRFCYEIARSTEKENEKLREECWTFLKKTYVDDNSKKIYNIPELKCEK